MMDACDLREEGEVSDNDEVTAIYKPVERPQQSFRMQQQKRKIDSESEESEGQIDSDEDAIAKPKIKTNHQKPPANTQQRANATNRKNGNIWQALLQEEGLTEDLQTFDVSSRKRKYERGAESYDFEGHRVIDQNELKRKKFDPNEEGSSSSNASTNSKGRKVKKAKYHNRNPMRAPKMLPNITISFNNSDEEYGQLLAKNLEEKKSDLIIRVVSVIGKDESLNLYSKTQNIEKKGGLLTMNKQRRRTPGGIFLWLLKTSKSVDEKQKKEIFDDDKEIQMSEGNWPSKTDPPPPSPVDEIANNEKPEPNLVSQKILSSMPERRIPSSSLGEDEVLELDYNSDMDTF